MAKYKKMLKSFKNYLNTINSLTYDDLTECIQAEEVWDDGYTRRNPTSYELFASHEHLDLPKETIFKYAGIVLDLEAFDASAQKVEEIWQENLPQLFPGHKFVIHKCKDHKQVAFCRKRTGVTENPDEIIKYLTHDHHNIRWNAMLSATIFPHPKLVPHLLDRLDDDDIYNVLKAIVALGASGDSGAADTLTNRFLKLEKTPEGKYFINDFFAYDLFKTLVKLGDNGYKPVFELLQKYKELDSHTLEHLCELIPKSGKPQALNTILDIYFYEPEACQSALTGLLNTAETAFPVIVPFLNDKDEKIRQKAMWFLANSFIKEARQYLVAGLQDKSSQVREAAVYGIGRFYHRSRKQLLLKALDDRANNVRLKAIDALGNLFDPKLLPNFQVLCLHKNPKIRREAMRAVSSLDSKEGLEFLYELFDQSSKADQLAIIDSLYAYTGKRAHLKPLISKALASGEKQIVRETTELLEII